MLRPRRFHRLRCRWSPLPTRPANTTGANETAIPCARATARIVWRSDEVRVRERDPGSVRHRELELTGRVLGVELHHAGPLRLERPDQRRSRTAPGRRARERCSRARRARGSGPARRARRAASRHPRKNSSSYAPRSSSPCAVSRSSIRRANERPHGGHVFPSWSRWSTAAIAQPGDAASATAEAGSGIRRVSPAGPSMPGDRGDAVVHQEDREHGGQAHAEPRDLLEAPERDAPSRA